MTSPYLLSFSTVVPASLDAAFTGVLDAPLETLFTERAGVIPPIKECTGQDGGWDAVGKTRTVVLQDGSSNLETLVEYSRPGSYRYQLSDFTGPMKALVAKVEGQFTFVPEGDATRVTWSWKIHPTNPLARQVLPVVGFFWRRYAAGMWPRYAASLT
ncbi:hypothetical protein ABIE44_002197 [Marmoricola sp. OAE513]|uniref:SRPBCC family protein n=1 Tax=Marmoricola sp. OAE513 TaxID=2817894 RepID=UPI001AEA2F78